MAGATTLDHVLSRLAREGKLFGWLGPGVADLALPAPIPPEDPQGEHVAAERDIGTTFGNETRTEA